MARKPKIKVTITWGDIPCHACGKPVTVVLPFTGCVWCKECQTTQTVSYTGQDYLGLEIN